MDQAATKLVLPAGDAGEGSFLVRVVPGARRRAYVIAHDVSAFELSQPMPSMASDRSFWELFETAPLPIAIDDTRTDATHQTRFNRRFSEVFGYTIEEVPTLHHWWPLAYPNPAYREEVRREWFMRVERAARLGQTIQPMRCVVRCKDGTERTIEFSAASIGTRDVVMFTDLTDHENATHELARAVERMAQLNRELFDSGRRDTLTGLGNRQRLDEDLAAHVERARRYGHKFAVALADVDHFKDYNDAVGHLAGDEALRVIASSFYRNLRAGDAAYRFGGEEFLFLLAGQDDAAASIAMERQRCCVEAMGIPHPASPVGKMVTISVGVASFHVDEPDSSESVIRRADEALYAAKGTGRNRVALAESTESRTANSSVRDRYSTQSTTRASASETPKA